MTQNPRHTMKQRIQEGILAALADGHVHTWSRIRRSLPGTRWEQCLAAVDLRDRGDVDADRYGTDPETYLALPLAPRKSA